MSPATWRPWPGMDYGLARNSPYDSPYDYERIALQRRGSESIRRVDTERLRQNPYFNVADLWWRPA